ncbi:uncharacterized protein LOC111017826 [Momordica charantia]|uniref:Uncharacterized protein LOC111017826 n=1 Tax=Momordica charantia TaxID=3673 RepID=A0A6J1D894_MOMCH|nr:uncharacterized protein LOC111017826 [Momordica charantia]
MEVFKGFSVHSVITHFYMRSELEYDEPELLVDNDDPPTPEVMNEVWKNKKVEEEEPIEVIEHKVAIDLSPSPLKIGPFFPFPQRSLEINNDIKKEELTQHFNDKIKGEIGEDEVGSDEGFYFKEEKTTIQLFKNKFIQVSHLPLSWTFKYVVL